MYTCLLIVAVLDTCYEKLKEDVHSFRKGSIAIVLLKTEGVEQRNLVKSDHASM